MAVLEIRNLNKSFHSGFALRNIHLSLKENEVHVIVGENGSGKSVLMKIVSGLFQRDSGSILLQGNEVDFSSLSAARKAGIYYQHQDIQLFSNLTVAENIFFDNLPQRRTVMKSFDRSKLEADCTNLFQELGIQIDPRELVSGLGYAEGQLLSAVKAYASGAQIIIFDEPTAAMSEAERKVFFLMVEKLRKRCSGIFYISHRMDEITTVGDRVTVIHHGSVISTSPTGTISRNSLVEMMSGDTHRERYPRLKVKKGKTIFEVRNLKVNPILKDVSFSLHKGEILGITGLMGSGRTCLANTLFGIEQPSSGTILVEGKEVALAQPSDAMQLGIALIPEDREENAIFHPLNLTDNMTMASLNRFKDGLPLDSVFMRQLVHDYSERLSIHPGNPEDILRSYSGGNQQKVMVARWFMKRSKIYLLDEPTRGVDPSAKIDIYNAMNDLITKGASIILISSDIEEILGMCDRIMVLAGGRIVCDLPRQNARKSLILDYATDER